MPEVVTLFRAGLLTSVPVALARPARPALAATLSALGAEVRPLEVASDDAVPAEATGAAALVVDAAALFAAAGAEADELAALRAAADGTWIAVRAVANAAWIEPQAEGGKVVVVAPRPGDGSHADAARAALENLARTLSIEWSRYGIRTTTIAPGAGATDEDVAGLVAYLVSPAGDYFSGALLAPGSLPICD